MRYGAEPGQDDGGAGADTGGAGCDAAGAAGGWIRSNEGEPTWSAFDVVVHLIHCERDDWVPRARVILESKDGELRQFPPFDRWGEIYESRSMKLEEVLEAFARVRAENLRTVREWGLGEKRRRCGEGIRRWVR